MAAVDAAIARGGVDENRLFVTGGSGGGVLTAWIVGTTDRFKAAAVQKPVINWASFALTADLPNFFYKYWFSAPPWEDYQAYWQRSPLSRVGNVKRRPWGPRAGLPQTEPGGGAVSTRPCAARRRHLLLRYPGSHSLDVQPSQLNARIAYILDGATSTPHCVDVGASPLASRARRSRERVTKLRRNERALRRPVDRSRPRLQRKGSSF